MFVSHIFCDKQTSLIIWGGNTFHIRGRKQCPLIRCPCLPSSQCLGIETQGDLRLEKPAFVANALGGGMGAKEPVGWRRLLGRSRHVQQLLGLLVSPTHRPHLVVTSCSQQWVVPVGPGWGSVAKTAVLRSQQHPRAGQPVPAGRVWGLGNGPRCPVSSSGDTHLPWPLSDDRKLPPLSCGGFSSSMDSMAGSCQQPCVQHFGSPQSNRRSPKGTGLPGLEIQRRLTTQPSKTPFTSPLTERVHPVLLQK